MIQIKEVDEPLSDMINKAVPNFLSREDEKAINRCQLHSASSYIVLNDDKLLCVWGLIPPSIISREVYLWMHVTPNVEGNHFLFVRHTQMVLDDILKDYEVIIGQVKVNAPQAKKFMKLLGAKFGAQVGDFIQFRIERKWQ